MKVLLTGAFGNVGLSTLEELIKKGYDVRVFDINTHKNRNIANKYKKKVEIIWGDLRNIENVEEAVESQDVVIHTAAIIPPQADRRPKFAESVNVEGTANIIKATEKQTQKPKFIYTSSIAIYGDRCKSPLIRASDHPNPNPEDEYARQKLKCEGLIRNSGLKWIIFRLTYVVSPSKLQMDPLMFDMPLDTSIEICHTKDVGLALANAVESHDIWGETMHIAGGEKCRIIYKDYLNKMTEIFGLGKDFLPDEAFSKGGFHCGFMTTDKSQKYLKYQRYTLDDYFNEVKKKTIVKRHFMKILKPVIRMYLLGKSCYYKMNKKTALILLLLLVSTAVYARDVKRYLYFEITEGKGENVVYNVVRSTEGFEVKMESKETEFVIETDLKYDNKKYYSRNLKNGKEATFLRKDGMMKVSDSSGIREFKLKPLPWYQKYFCVEDFLSSGEKKRVFYIMVIHKGKKHAINKPTEFVMKKLKEEVLDLESGKIDTVKVKITLNDFRSFFWKAYYWYRKSDGMMVRYKIKRGPPGTPLTTGVVVAEE